MVVLNNADLAWEHVIVNGGIAENQREDGCANGAAGTVFMKNSDILVIDNQN